MNETTDAATPGSDAAINIGCRCPALDNAHGRGFMGGAKDTNGNTVYVINGNCPLHGTSMLNKLVGTVTLKDNDL